jgi:aryl carrier-like protein
MFVWSLADGRLFVRTVEELILRLNFDSGVEPARLSPALVSVRSIVADVWAYAHRAGEDGVRFCELAGRLVDDLELVVRDQDAGDRSAWTARRGEILDVWSELEQLVDQAAPASAPAGDRPVATVPAPAAAVSGGEKAKRAKERSGRGRGRRAKPAGASRQDEAAWWRDQAHLLPAIGERGDDVKLMQMVQLFREHGFEVSLRELGALDVPAWWPVGPDGRPVTVCRFRDRWRNVSPDSWAKYVQRADNRLLRPIGPRHNSHNIDVPKPTGGVGRRACTSAEQVSRAFADAIDLASGLMQCDGEKRRQTVAKIGRILETKLGMDAAQIDGLMAMGDAGLVEELTDRQREVERLRSRK